VSLLELRCDLSGSGGRWQTRPQSLAALHRLSGLLPALAKQLKAMTEHSSFSEEKLSAADSCSLERSQPALPQHQQHQQHQQQQQQQQEYAISATQRDVRLYHCAAAASAAVRCAVLRLEASADGSLVWRVTSAAASANSSSSSSISSSQRSVSVTCSLQELLHSVAALSRVAHKSSRRVLVCTDPTGDSPLSPTAATATAAAGERELAAPTLTALRAASDEAVLQWTQSSAVAAQVLALVQQEAAATVTCAGSTGYRIVAAALMARAAAADAAADTAAASAERTNSALGVWWQALWIVDVTAVVTVLTAVCEQQQHQQLQQQQQQQQQYLVQRLLALGLVRCLLRACGVPHTDDSSDQHSLKPLCTVCTSASPSSSRAKQQHGSDGYRDWELWQAIEASSSALQQCAPLAAGTQFVSACEVR
jgi:hypothetical protein